MRVLAGLLALAAVSAPFRAHAYCRSTTNLDFVETVPPTCDTAGKPLYWSSGSVSMSVNQKASAKVPLDVAEGALASAFAKWAGADCSICGSSEKPRVVGALGASTDVGFGYLRDGATNTNVLVFYDENWPRQPGQLALTTVTFKVDTGEIIDADMEIDATQNISTTGAAEAYDLESIITHEVGHVLGIAHSADPEATMRPSYEAGDTSLRDLARDDVCAICPAPPPSSDAGSTPDSATPTPENSVGDPAEAPGYTCNCSVPGRSTPLGGAALLLALVVTRSRSRNARSSRTRRS